MPSVNQISVVYLSVRYDTAEFLNSRRNFTRELGKSDKLEQKFVEGDLDRKGSHGEFRGIEFLNPSPFGASPLKDWRGILSTPSGGFAHPSNYNNDNPRRAEELDFDRMRDWVYLKQHPKVADMLAADPGLREKYFDETLNEDSELRDQITDIARQRLESQYPIDDDYLEYNPEEAELLALNIGGIADLVNEDEAIGEALTGQTRTLYSEDIREELAVETADLMDPATGLDADFFMENPEAAIYLQNHIGLVERLNQRVSDAENFRQHYNSINNVYKQEVLEKAKAALSSKGEFIEDYMEADFDLALDVVIDKKLNGGESIADNTVLFYELSDESVLPNEVYDKHIATKAAKIFNEDTVFNRHYFSKYPEFGLSINRSDELAAGLQESIGDVRRFFSQPDVPSPHKLNIWGAMRSYTSGYPLRTSEIIDIRS